MIRRALIPAVLLFWGSVSNAADDQPICADRPGKANPTCTVPEGMLQIETGLAAWSRDRADGVRLDALGLGATAFKYGLSDRWHMEVDVAPYVWQRARAGGLEERDSSFGDLVIASKVRLTSGDGVQVALNPAVKVPTAKRPIGNRKWEAALALPIDYAIPGSPFSVTLGPAIAWFADEEGNGHDPSMVQVAALGWQVTDKLNLSGELWGQWTWGPDSTARQASADAAVAYLVNDNLQLDVGGNFRLNRETADVELYAGFAARF